MSLSPPDQAPRCHHPKLALLPSGAGHPCCSCCCSQPYSSSRRSRFFPEGRSDLFYLREVTSLPFLCGCDPWDVAQGDQGWQEIPWQGQRCHPGRMEPWGHTPDPGKEQIPEPGTGNGSRCLQGEERGMEAALLLVVAALHRVPCPLCLKRRSQCATNARTWDQRQG